MFTYTFPGGDLLDNQVVGATNFSESTAEHRIPVPSGKRALLFGGVVYRDNIQTVLIEVYNSDNKIIYPLSSLVAAATNVIAYPHQIANILNPFFGSPLPLKAGDYLKFTFDGAMGANAIISAIWLEVDV